MGFYHKWHIEHATSKGHQAKVEGLLARSMLYQGANLGIDRNGDYLWTTNCTPADQLQVGTSLFPIVEAPEWGLGDDNQLTVNCWDHLILNTRNLLMLDIDFGDCRLNKWLV